jgi:hypothetical protein
VVFKYQGTPNTWGSSIKTTELVLSILGLVTEVDAFIMLTSTGILGAVGGKTGVVLSRWY